MLCCRTFPRQFGSDTNMQFLYEETLFDYQFIRVLAHITIYAGSEAQDCAAAVISSDT
jgi:hypothetical protein